MKNKKIIGLVAIAVLAMSQFSFAVSADDEAIQRLVKIAKQRKAEEAKQVVTVTEEIENGVLEVTVSDDLEANKTTTTATTKTVPAPKPIKKVKMKRPNKNLTESQKMDVEIQRISKRVNEINGNIERFKKNEALLDKMEERLNGIQEQISQ